MFVELQGPNVSSTNNFAYYVSRNESLHLVAREGQEIPGTGLTIVDLNIQPQMYMNDLGQFVFYALLSPDGGLANANFAYVGTDESGSLRILMMPSLQLHPSNGPAAYLGGVTMNPRSLLSDAGKVVMGGVVTETSGFTEGLFSIHMTPPVVEPAQCPADFNSDGLCTLDDLFSFLNALFAHDPQADFNHDENVTNQDLFDFIGAWFEGCP